MSKKQSNPYPLTEGNVRHRDRTYVEVGKKPTPPPPPPMRLIREGIEIIKSKKKLKEEVMKNKKFSLNQEVKDVVTGFKGIIMGITEYNTGCIQYGVASQKLDKSGRTSDWLWFDGSRLTSTGKKLNIKPAIGGPHQTAPQM